MSRTFDVALSFAGQDRAYVEQVVAHLERHRVRYFYDRAALLDTWGEDLAKTLDDVYRKRSRYVVMFISAAYARQIWTRHELQSALARAITERRAYILPARLDDTELPDLPPNIASIDLRTMSAEAFAEMIVAKVKGRGVAWKAAIVALLAIAPIAGSVTWMRKERGAQALREVTQGVVLRDAADPEKARQAFQSALAADPESAPAHSGLATLDADAGRFDSALAHARAAVRLEPDVAVYHYNLGNLLVSAGREVEAIGPLRRAIELEPGNGDAFNELGTIYLRLDRPRDALSFFFRGLEVDQTSLPLRKNLGRALLEAGGVENAVKVLEDARGRAASADLPMRLEILRWLAEAQARAGRKREACGHLQDLARLDRGETFQWTVEGRKLSESLQCADAR